jgi:saccharopine dehydrogenase (NAD+, L-lysine forming)
MRIGIIKEGKNPPDTRVPLTPNQCAYIMDKYGIEIWVQPSPNRCYTNAEYEAAGVLLTDEMHRCEVLLGVKEVKISDLIPNKTYFFFSHTIKRQPYNRELLRALAAKNIKMVDYELLKNPLGQRVIAFGRWAGIVGAHNGLWAYGQRTKTFELPRLSAFHDFEAAKQFYAEKLRLPPLKIVLTGTGRVGSGAAEVLEAMQIRRVKPRELLNETFTEPVFTQLLCNNYAARMDGAPFNKSDFYKNPQTYQSVFLPYAAAADVMINGIYWDNDAPAFFTKADMRQPEFKLKVIADITCDIAPLSSIPSTLFATTIAEPLFGYNPVTEQAEAPHAPHTIDMMTIDNLPNELPRDASDNFGEQFIEHVLEHLLNPSSSDRIETACITKNGDLMPAFEYLRKGYFEA